jgi:hypothetical protein
MRDRANEIIVSLLQSDEFNNCMKKVKPNLKDDLAGELALILLETDPERIVKLHDNKQLTFYTVRIILTLAFSKTSPFYKKYRLTHEEFKEVGMLDDFYSIVNRKVSEELALNEIEKLDWYEAEMVKLYLEVGNYRAMENKTNIPHSSCFLTVRKAIEKIKEKVI